jgi:recombination protein RecT
MSNDLTLISGTVYGVRETFAAVLSDKSIVFDREAEFALQLIGASDFAVKTARKNPQSLADAITNIGAIGITLNPARKLAYLVPRDHAIKLDISYMGLMDIAIATGCIRWAQASVVYQNDFFELQGYDRPPIHTFKPFGSDRGGAVGVYVVVKTPDGDFLTETMSTEEVLAIRDRSDAWKAFMAEKIKSCPWSTDPGEMSKKTVVKRAYKYWPKTPRLDQAIHYLNTDGGEGLAPPDAPAPAAPKPPPPTDLLGAARASADKGRASFAAWWAAATPAQREQLRAEIPDLKRRTEVFEASRQQQDPFVAEMEAAERRAA